MPRWPRATARSRRNISNTPATKACARWRAAGTVAVLLPGAFYFLRETRLPPIAALRDAGVPIAIATDCNPGSSPLTSLLLALNMACTLFRLTPEEALAGATAHAARALGMADSIGTLEVGKAADLAAWEIDTPAELAYAMGASPLYAAWVGGVRRTGSAVSSAALTSRRSTGRTPAARSSRKANGGASSM